MIEHSAHPRKQRSERPIRPRTIDRASARPRVAGGHPQAFRLARSLAILWLTIFALVAGVQAEETALNLTSKTGDLQNATWLKTVTTSKGPGKFAELPSMRMVYKFGWSAITAAKANVSFNNNEDSYSVDAEGATAGFPRTLFPLDVTHRERCNKKTLQPIHLDQEEIYHNQTVQTEVDFKSRKVTSVRKVSPEKEPPKTKSFDFSPAFDLESALFWVRSQPLNKGEKEVMVVYPSNAPYLATITVLGREKIRLNGQERNAIKLDLELKAIDKSFHLKPHKRFKSARGWLSDDNLRIPLRLEADIFIGYVFAELQSESLVNSVPNRR